MSDPIAQVETRFLTLTNTEEVKRVIIDRIRGQGGKITLDGAHKIVADFGSSFKMRLLGLTLAGVQTFPREVVVRLKGAENETQVTIVVRDTAGFGSRLGYTKAIELLMQQQAGDIKAGFPDAH